MCEHSDSDIETLELQIHALRQAMREMTRELEAALAVEDDDNASVRITSADTAPPS
jgi:hypothetical protein